MEKGADYVVFWCLGMREENLSGQDDCVEACWDRATIWLVDKGRRQFWLDNYMAIR